MRVLTDAEIQWIAGAYSGDGIQVSQVLTVGAGITGVSAAALAAVPSPSVLHLHATQNGLVYDFMCD